MSKAGLPRFLGAWAYGLLWNLNNASSLPAYSFRIVKAEEARKILRKNLKLK